MAIIYDCLFPNTIGGAERWYRELAERLGKRHSVTYLTRRQWGAEGAGTPFTTIAVSPGGALYTESGRRRIGPPLRFGLGVFLYLLRHGDRYDAVHVASFPYFSLLGAWAALRLRSSKARLVVDWHEAWGRPYWGEYLGRVGGAIGFAVQGLCMKLPDQSFVFSRLVERRLISFGHTAPITRLTGEYAGAVEPRSSSLIVAEPPLVLAAGRQIPEKRFASVAAAVAEARTSLPELRGVIVGDGPESAAIRASVAAQGLQDVIQVPGRVDSDRVAELIGAACCLLHPSEREGYGLVVVEASAAGTPSVVVAAEENAAVELVEDGVNGFVAASAEPAELARAIVAAVEGGEALRASTREWFERHQDELSIESSLAAVEAAYEEPGAVSAG